MRKIYNQKTIKKIIIALMLLLFAGTVLGAVETQINIEQQTPALTIVYPKILDFQVGNKIIMPFDVLNSNYSRLDNTAADCSYFVIDEFGDGLSSGDLVYNTTLNYWHFILYPSETINANTYNAYVHCNGTNLENGFVSFSFELARSNLSNGDRLPLVIAIAIFSFFLLVLSFKLEEEHFILKLVLIIFSMITIFLVPNVFMASNIDFTFYKLSLGVFVLFWIYLLIYTIYKTLLHYGIIVIPPK